MKLFIYCALMMSVIAFNACKTRIEDMPGNYLLSPIETDTRSRTNTLPCGKYFVLNLDGALQLRYAYQAKAGNVPGSETLVLGSLEPDGFSLSVDEQYGQPLIEIQQFGNPKIKLNSNDREEAYCIQVLTQVKTYTEKKVNAAKDSVVCLL